MADRARLLRHAAAALAVAALAAPLLAQETVDVVLPASVSFAVSNVSVSTGGTPAPTSISFSNAALLPGRALSILVKSDASAFTPPSGLAIPAGNVSWTASSATGGTGYAGALSSTVWSEVFRSVADPTSGGVDLTWQLAAPGGGIRSGSHTLVMRWKLESVVP